MDIRVEFKTGRGDILSNGMTVCEIGVPQLKARQYLFLPFDDFHRYFGAPEGVAGDLLVIAGSCYVIDQLIPRAIFADCWTRELEVSLPVAEPSRWNTIATDLAETLTFLTGDNWQISFHQRSVPIYRNRHRHLQRKYMHPANIVCLFSGGLDSFVETVNLLCTTKEPITLVGHYDLGSAAKATQSNLATELNKHFPRRCNLIQTRVGPVQNTISNSGAGSQVAVPMGGENTLRSRSLVFLALGLYIAQQHRRRAAVPLLMPENGFIALNPPLTDSRLGSCSTRTAHPFFLDRFHEIALRLGIVNPIENPLGSKTKGEILATSSSPGLVNSLASYTVSCAHPTRRQGWIRRNATQCGYCIPCIYRRAALHRVGLDQGDSYGLDVCAGELSLHEDVASDLRAVLSSVHDVQTGDFDSDTVARRMPLPIDLVPVASHVLSSGMNELTQLFRDKAVQPIQEWAGIF